MSALVLSGIIFVLVLGGVLLGALLRHTLPQHHLSKDSRMSYGLASASSQRSARLSRLVDRFGEESFDTQAGQIRQITAGIILLDNILEEYGPEAIPIRRQIRGAIGPVVDRLWREKAAKSPMPFVATAAAEKAYAEIQSLTPQNDMQRSLQARANQVSNDFAQTRLLLFVSRTTKFRPLLAILVFWLIIIFASFSLFSPVNPTVFGFLSLFAL